MQSEELQSDPAVVSAAFSKDDDVVDLVIHPPSLPPSPDPATVVTEYDSLDKKLSDILKKRPPGETRDSNATARMEAVAEDCCRECSESEPASLLSQTNTSDVEPALSFPKVHLPDIMSCDSAHSTKSKSSRASRLSKASTKSRSSKESVVTGPVTSTGEVANTVGVVPSASFSDAPRSCRSSRSSESKSSRGSRFSKTTATSKSLAEEVLVAGPPSAPIAADPPVLECCESELSRTSKSSRRSRVSKSSTKSKASFVSRETEPQSTVEAAGVVRAVSFSDSPPALEACGSVQSAKSKSSMRSLLSKASKKSKNSSKGSKPSASPEVSAKSGAGSKRPPLHLNKRESRPTPTTISKQPSSIDQNMSALSADSASTSVATPKRATLSSKNSSLSVEAGEGSHKSAASIQRSISSKQSTRSQGTREATKSQNSNKSILTSKSNVESSEAVPTPTGVAPAMSWPSYGARCLSVVTAYSTAEATEAVLSPMKDTPGHASRSGIATMSLEDPFSARSLASGASVASAASQEPHSTASAACSESKASALPTGDSVATRSNERESVQSTSAASCKRDPDSQPLTAACASSYTTTSLASPGGTSVASVIEEMPVQTEIRSISTEEDCIVVQVAEEKTQPLGNAAVEEEKTQSLDIAVQVTEEKTQVLATVPEAEEPTDNGAVTEPNEKLVGEPFDEPTSVTPVADFVESETSKSKKRRNFFSSFKSPSKLPLARVASGIFTSRRRSSTAAKPASPSRSNVTSIVKTRSGASVASGLEDSAEAKVSPSLIAQTEEECNVFTEEDKAVLSALALPADDTVADDKIVQLTSSPTSKASKVKNAGKFLARVFSLPIPSKSAKAKDEDAAALQEVARPVQTEECPDAAEVCIGSKDEEEDPEKDEPATEVSELQKSRVTETILAIGESVDEEPEGCQLSLEAPVVDQPDMDEVNVVQQTSGLSSMVSNLSPTFSFFNFFGTRDETAEQPVDSSETVENAKDSFVDVTITEEQAGGDQAAARDDLSDAKELVETSKSPSFASERKVSTEAGMVTSSSNSTALAIGACFAKSPRGSSTALEAQEEQEEQRGFHGEDCLEVAATASKSVSCATASAATPACENVTAEPSIEQSIDPTILAHSKEPIHVKGKKRGKTFLPRLFSLMKTTPATHSGKLDCAESSKAVAPIQKEKCPVIEAPSVQSEDEEKILDKGSVAAEAEQNHQDIEATEAALVATESSPAVTGSASEAVSEAQIFTTPSQTAVVVDQTDLDEDKMTIEKKKGFLDNMVASFSPTNSMFGFFDRQGGSDPTIDTKGTLVEAEERTPDADIAVKPLTDNEIAEDDDHTTPEDPTDTIDATDPIELDQLEKSLSLRGSPNPVVQEVNDTTPKNFIEPDETKRVNIVRKSPKKLLKGFFGSSKLANGIKDNRQEQTEELEHETVEDSVKHKSQPRSEDSAGAPITPTETAAEGRPLNKKKSLTSIKRSLLKKKRPEAKVLVPEAKKSSPKVLVNHRSVQTVEVVAKP